MQVPGIAQSVSQRSNRQSVRQHLALYNFGLITSQLRFRNVYFSTQTIRHQARLHCLHLVHQLAIKLHVTIAHVRR
jgi:hypothetical protein